MPTALISTHDRTGVLDLASGLLARGWRLVASDGTARFLAEAGLAVTPVSVLTGEPPLCGGRVKTLHASLHAAILARDTEEDRAELRARGIEPIALVAVTLYPFSAAAADPQATFEEVVEQVDVGGVALLRAAAKNWARVTVLCDPSDYPRALDPPADALRFRAELAARAFACTAAYDAAIAAFLAARTGAAPSLQLSLYPAGDLRYGENPHQAAAYFRLSPHGAEGPLGGRVLQGKALSYNNLLDLDAALRTACAFSEAAVAVVKHASPCGVAVAADPADALALALACDPVSAFGGVVAANRPVDEAFVDRLEGRFVEGLAAPGFTSGARARLGARKNLRLLELPAGWMGPSGQPFEVRSVLGGLLWQVPDLGDPPDAPAWRVVTRRTPTPEETVALRFAWAACRNVRSNAAVLARLIGPGCLATAGIGGGQPNRRDAVRLAVERAGERAAGAVLASDGFFPFPDGVLVAASSGVTAIIQPGGSVRDAEVVAAADEAGLAMVVTGVRHFRH